MAVASRLWIGLCVGWALSWSVAPAGAAESPSVGQATGEAVGHVVAEATTGSDHEHVDYNKPQLSPSMPLFLFSLGLFGLFVLVMQAFVWRPLIAGLNAREARVARAEQEAHQARVQVEQLKVQADRQLAAVQEQVKEILSQARASAEARKLEIIAQAEQDAQRIKAEALAAIAAARNAALEELEQSVDQQVGVATTQLAGRRF